LFVIDLPPLIQPLDSPFDMAKGHQLDTGKKPKKKKPGFDWFEASVNGGSLILGVLKEAAEFAPVPFLKQAAGTTLKIVSTVQVGFLIRVCEARHSRIRI